MIADENEDLEVVLNRKIESIHQHDVHIPVTSPVAEQKDVSSDAAPKKSSFKSDEDISEAVRQALTSHLTYSIPPPIPIVRNYDDYTKLCQYRDRDLAKSIPSRTEKEWDKILDDSFQKVFSFYQKAFAPASPDIKFPLSYGTKSPSLGSLCSTSSVDSNEDSSFKKEEEDPIDDKIDKNNVDRIELKKQLEEIALRYIPLREELVSNELDASKKDSLENSIFKLAGELYFDALNGPDSSIYSIDYHCTIWKEFELFYPPSPKLTYHDEKLNLDGDLIFALDGLYDIAKNIFIEERQKICDEVRINKYERDKVREQLIDHQYKYGFTLPPEYDFQRSHNLTKENEEEVFQERDRLCDLIQSYDNTLNELTSFDLTKPELIPVNRLIKAVKERLFYDK
jgi:hypothetical protein